MNFNKYLSSKNINHILLAIILLAGGAMRFYGFGDFSLSNDELGALSRLRYPSLGEVIRNSAILDTHPPLVEIFLFFWTHYFGDSEAVLRFPFVLCGIFSILFSYKIASRWFNPMTGLMAASAMAFLAFPILYSRVARPYSPGLLFFLMNVWCWHLLLFEPGVKKRKAALLYGITGGLCMATHYICLLSAAITGITGLIFCRKKNIVYYLAGGGLALVLFLPCWKIFQYHFFEKKGIGGETGWLNQPTPDFLWKYLLNSFNHSNLVFYSACFIFMLSVSLNINNLRFTRFHFIALLWFIIPFIITYYYSVNRNPVLQDRILLFSYPFFLFSLFSFFSDEKARTKSIIVMAAGIVFIWSTVQEKRFYSTPQFEEFKLMAEKAIDFSVRYGESKLIRAVNLNSPYYIDYYLEKSGKKIPFDSYRSGSYSIIDSMIKAKPADYFFFGWSCISTPMEMIPVIRKSFPFLIDKEYFCSTEFYFFSRKCPENYSEPSPVFSSLNDFEKPVAFWGGNDSAITDTFRYKGVRCARIGKRFPYSPTLSIRLRKLIKSVDDRIFMEANGYVLKKGGEVKICISFEDKEGEIYSWHGMNFSNFIDSAGIWKPVFLACNVPEIKSGDDLVKIFAWNLSDTDVFIDDFTVKVENGNPFLYGKRYDQEILDD